MTEGDDRYFDINQSQFEWAASIITIGCAVSCLPIGIMMKKFGRKWTMISLVVPFMIGWVLVIWAQNLAMLLSGRFMLGLAGGAFCVSAPQYSSEIAEKEVRGMDIYILISLKPQIEKNYLFRQVSPEPSSKFSSIAASFSCTLSAHFSVCSGQVLFAESFQSSSA